jgi:5-hydroxyisourate hydrolase-like protein (transthyretin family)
MPPKLRAAVALLFASLLPLHAQQAKDRVAGRVVSSFDQHPIAHATVTLQDTRPGAKPLTSTATDDGDFSFPAVPSGTYRLSGGAPGYLTLPYQSHDGFFTGIVTGAGLATDALILQIDPASTISGHILDEASDPVERAQLNLYRDVAGHITRIRNASTDTDGEYEFDKLAPGRYFLTAFATPWYAVHPRSDQPKEIPQYRVAVDPALDVAYPLTFYSRALDSDGASPIVLNGGNQVTADMQLSPTPAMSISLRTPPGNVASQRFPMISHSVFGSDESVQIQMTENVSGMMRIPGFAPGQYKIQEFTPDGHFQTGSAIVDLTTGPISMEWGGHVDLATVSVTVHGANGESLPAHLQLAFRNPAVTNFGQASTIDQNKVEVPSVPPGDYRLTLSGGGHEWNLITLAVNGKPVPDKLLHITAGGNIPIDLTISSSLSSVEGIARRDGKPAGGSMVVLVPAGGDTSEDLFRRDQSNLDGGFTFSNVVPGNYLVVAIDDGWSLRWSDAATLTSYLMHAVPISIPSTGSPTIHLPEPLSTQPR